MEEENAQNQARDCVLLVTYCLQILMMKGQ